MAFSRNVFVLSNSTLVDTAENMHDFDLKKEKKKAATSEII